MTNDITLIEVDDALSDLIHAGIVSQNQLGRNAYLVLIKIRNDILETEPKSNVNLHIEMHTDTLGSPYVSTNTNKF